MIHDVFMVALICGLCSLDTAAMLQSMISRPLAVATLCGFALHAPQAGLACGCLIELLWLGNLPVGSVVPADFTLASGLSSSLAILMHRSLPGFSWESLASLSLLLAVPIAWLGGWADLLQRRRSGALAAWAERRLDLGDESGLWKAVAISLGVTFARGFFLSALGMLLLRPLLLTALAQSSASLRQALDWLYWLALLLGFAVLVDLFWERRWIKVGGLSFAASALAAYTFHWGGPAVLALAVAVGVLLAVLTELRLRRHQAGGEA